MLQHGEVVRGCRPSWSAASLPLPRLAVLAATRFRLGSTECRFDHCPYRSCPGWVSLEGDRWAEDGTPGLVVPADRGPYKRW